MRKYWIQTLTRIIEPVLKNLAAGTLHQNMPIEARTGCVDERKKYSHLEAMGRALVGTAPWLASESDDPWEVSERERISDLARAAIAAATDPDSPDFCNFDDGAQPLVDAAFLCHAILRAPSVLWEPLDMRVKQNLIKCLQKTRSITPYRNNWLLFSAMVEAALYLMEGKCDIMRIEYAIYQHEQWFKGDGVYGDGPDFHFDYYNSYVIHPMMMDVMNTVGHLIKGNKDNTITKRITERAIRYAVMQEMLIAPDGSFPAVGRSITYRSGAFQILAQIALAEMLPSKLSPAAVRCALTAVIHRCFEEANTFDKNGWLRIGLCGSQPELGEAYISTGSQYLCTAAFLPLGLSPNNPFWRDPDEPWSWIKRWNAHSPTWNPHSSQ